ncbi:MAG: response regulator [Ktedonobacterales bacterium]
MESTTHKRVLLLVVDDDREIRRAVRYILEDAGYSVLEAPDGEVALQMLRKHKEPMVILLDLMMPRLDGAGVLRTVADDAHLARQRAFVLITANVRTMPLSFANLLTQLAVPVLAKPFDMDQLLELVAAAECRVAS